MNLTGINPITEENKNDWINWLKDLLDDLDNVNYDNYETNRVFGTQKDDIDEVKDILGAFFLTLQKNILTPKSNL